ncbi:MAG: hypothetical protein IIA81_05610 [Thaumarchaeota archaeon]|nr:hypothetical protein [Nitrososphaerota archaeon]
MSSSKKLGVNRNKIITWLQEDKIPFKEVDVSKMPKLAWDLSVDNNHVLVYSITNLPDRVYIQRDIRLGKILQKIVNKDWKKSKLNGLLIDTESALTNLNVRHQILFNDKKEFTGIRMFLILIDSLNKDTFLNSHLRISEVFATMLQGLSSFLGVEIKKLKQAEKESSENPLAS